MAARICFALEIGDQGRVPRNKRVPRQQVLEELRTDDRAAESCDDNDGSRQAASNRSNDQDGRNGESQRGNAHGPKNVIVILNNGPCDHASPEVRRIVDRVPPARAHQGKVSADKKDRAHDRAGNQSVADKGNHA
jgi:hypothetical protein